MFKIYQSKDPYGLEIIGETESLFCELVNILFGTRELWNGEKIFIDKLLLFLELVKNDIETIESLPYYELTDDQHCIIDIKNSPIESAKQLIILIENNMEFLNQIADFVSYRIDGLSVNFEENYKNLLKI